MSTIFLDFDGTLVDLSQRSVDNQVVNFISKEAVRLLQDFQVVLVTGSPQKEVEQILSLLDSTLQISLAEIISAEKGGNTKATGKPFLDLMKKYQGPFIVIGDSANDEDGARRAGCFFVRVNKKDSNYEQLTELIRCLEEAKQKITQKGD